LKNLFFLICLFACQGCTSQAIRPVPPELVAFLNGPFGVVPYMAIVIVVVGGICGAIGKKNLAAKRAFVKDYLKVQPLDGAETETAVEGMRQRSWTE